MPMATDNEPEIEVSCPMWCCCCALIETLFKHGFKEIIDEVHSESLTSKKIFDQMEKGNDTSTTIFRWVSWIMSVIGHCLLFSPIIALLNWIPLVGWLLANILSAVVFIFSLIWASTLHFLILGVAWIVYRPLYGLLLLSGTALLCFLMFFPIQQVGMVQKLE